MIQVMAGARGHGEAESPSLGVQAGSGFVKTVGEWVLRRVGDSIRVSGSQSCASE